MRELGNGWDFRWIAADHTREASLEQGMEPWIAQNDDLIDVCLEIADKSEDPQLVSQISCGGQHKNAAAVHVWAWPNRQLVMGGCF